MWQVPLNKDTALSENTKLILYKNSVVLLKNLSNNDYSAIKSYDKNTGKLDFLGEVLDLNINSGISFPFKPLTQRNDLLYLLNGSENYGINLVDGKVN